MGSHPNSRLKPKPSAYARAHESLFKQNDSNNRMWRQYTCLEVLTLSSVLAVKYKLLASMDMTAVIKIVVLQLKW